MKGIIFLAVLGIVYGAPTEGGNILCGVCHLLVGQVQTLVAGGETQGAISNYVNSVCERLPGDDKDVCQTFMKDNSETLFLKLVTDLTPSQFCEQLTNVCPRADVIVDQIPRPLIQEEVEENVQGPLECELCKLAVLAVDKLIGTNRSEAAINATLEKFCSSLPEKLADVCHEIEPAILQGLKSGFDPSIVCKLVKLCTLDGGVEDIEQIPCDVCHTAMDALGLQDPEGICAPLQTCKQEVETFKTLQPEQVEDTLECQLCKFLVQAIDQLVGENKSVDAINSTLLNLCNDLPGELKDACLNAEPDILKAILGGIDPTQACDFIKFCQNYAVVPVSSAYIPCDVCKETLEAIAGENGVAICNLIPGVCASEKEPEYEAPKSFKETNPPDNDTITLHNRLSKLYPCVKVVPKCSLCQFLVKSVVDLIQSDTSHEVVTFTLEQICDLMPEEERAFCEEYGGDVVEYVKNGGQDSMSGCTVNKACEGFEVESQYVAETEPVHVSADARCELCKFMVTFADQLVKDNATLQKVNETLLGICKVLPANVQTTCAVVVPIILSTIESGLDPKQTCDAAKFCTDATEWSELPELSCELCMQLADFVFSEKTNNEEVAASMCEAKCYSRNRRSVDLVEFSVSQIERVTEKYSQSGDLGGVLECDLCKVVIGTIDTLVGENATEEKINATLYGICIRLSGAQLVQMCLQEYPKLLVLLSNGVKPDIVCKTAKLCEAEDVSSKTNNILKQEDVKGDVRDLKCEVCSDIIDVIDKILAENSTDAQINATVYQACEQLPGAFMDLCLQAAPQIVSTLVKGANSSVVCKAIGLCTAVTGNSNPIDMNRNLKDLKCEVCRGIIDELDKILAENSTDAQINATVYQVCEQLPGAFNDMCLQAAPMIVSALVEGANSSVVCEQIGLCTAVTGVTEAQIMKQNLKDLKCQVCRGIIDELDKILAENSTDAQINATVYQVCEQLPGAFMDLCLQAAPKIVSALVEGANSSVVCEQIGFCTGITDVTQAQTIQIEMNPNLGDEKCDLCRELVQMVDKAVEDNVTDAKINSTLYTLCSGLPSGINDMCMQLIPQIMSTLERGFDPNTTCELASLCPGPSTSNINGRSKKMSMAHNTRMNVEIATRNLGDAKCDLCRELVQMVDKAVEDNATDEKINSTLYNLCSGLPSGINVLCMQLIPQIMTTLEHGFDPNKTCELAQLCSGPATSKQIEVKPVGEIKCEICEFLVDGLDDILKTNRTEAAINSTVYMLCTKLPAKSIVDLCYLIAPDLVKEMSKGLSPQAACTDIKLCTKTLNVILDNKKQELECDICMKSLQFVYDDVANNYEKIQRPLLTLCQNLPNMFRAECITAIKADNGRFFKQFLQSYTPTLLCEMAECADTNGHRRITNKS